MRRPLLATWLLLGVFGPAAAQPLAPLPANQWDVAAAAHLLRRAGFGGTPEEVRALAALGLDAAVDRLVDFTPGAFALPPPELPALVREPLFERSARGGRDGPDPAEAGATPPAADPEPLTDEQRRARQQQRLRAERQAHRDLRAWWLERMLRTPQPLEEKLTLFWHGHFTSGAREVKRALFMLEQNELLRTHALGNFHALLRAISRDRAMLVYLDNARNSRRTPNENYARELLELFTLGEGQYTEADVRAAARALTGWSFDQDGFRFRRMLHDPGPKTFLGQTGNWDGDDILRIILTQPACSEHLARRLLVFFCRPDPPDELVRRFAAVIRDEDYELRPVLKTLFKSRAFYGAAARGSLVKSPVDLLVGTARQLGLEFNDCAAAEQALAALGQELMQPPNVRGWPGGTRWINTATLYQRYNFVGQMIAGAGPRAAGRGLPPAGAPAEPAEPVTTAEAMAADAEPDDPELRPLRRRGAAGPPYDPGAVIARYGLRSAADVVDFYVARLLAAPLPADKRAALIGYLGADSDPAATEAAARIRMMLHLLCSTPEYQLL